MKKALVLTTTSGFLSQFELNNVKLLQEKGYQIHYATNFGVPIYEVKDERLRNMGIVLHHISIEKSPFQFKKNIWAYRELKRIIDREKIDVVHCHNPVGGLLGRLAAYMSRRKPFTIYSAHGFHFFNGAPLVNWLFYYPVEKFLARFTDVLITINKEDYNIASTFKYKNNGQVMLIPGVGVDTSVYIPSSVDEQDIRKEWNIPKDAFHIVSVGELNKNKNHSTIIKALSSLSRRDIYYSICGEGPYRRELEKLIEERHLKDRVFLRGYRTDVLNVYRSADISAFPSFREGMGMAALESLACGVPVVAADNRGTREYMSDGNNGYCCDPNSIEEFSKAILTAYEQRDLLKTISAKAVMSVKGFTLIDNERVMREIYGLLPKSHVSRYQYESGECPMVSVIMGVYNQHDRLAFEMSVDSIINQTYIDWEFLIYNDGSDDEVTEYIESLPGRDSRIRIIGSKSNHGLGFALNRCIDEARGKYLARMDADDVSHPDRIRKEVEFMEQHDEYMWCGSNCEIFDEGGVWADGVRPEIPQANDYLKYSPYIHPTVMYRASLFDGIAGYAEDRRTQRCEDYELFMRLFRLGYQGYNIQEPLLDYYIDRKKYHKRPLRDSIYEGHVRLQGYRRMGLMWPKGWLYVLRPIISKMLPRSFVVKIKENIGEV